MNAIYTRLRDWTRFTSFVFLSYINIVPGFDLPAGKIAAHTVVVVPAHDSYAYIYTASIIVYDIIMFFDRARCTVIIILSV